VVVRKEKQTRWGRKILKDYFKSKEGPKSEREYEGGVVRPSAPVAGPRVGRVVGAEGEERGMVGPPVLKNVAPGSALRVGDK